MSLKKFLVDFVLESNFGQNFARHTETALKSKKLALVSLCLGEVVFVDCGLILEAVF